MRTNPLITMLAGLLVATCSMDLYASENAPSVEKRRETETLHPSESKEHLNRVEPPRGRLAIVADGNSPDPDDVGATAVMFGLLKATGLNDRLVHLSHSCDLKRATRISVEDEMRRQKVLHQLCKDGIFNFGPFENLAKPINCRTDQDAAVNDLRNAINASSKNDPLWIVEAGEPDIIGFALKAADPNKRQFIHVISHHPANDNAGDFFKWQQILDFGVTEHQIGDQNVGLQTAIKEWDWAKDHDNANIKWIWKQLEYAEQDGVVKFQTNKFDCSDAGMVYWWITGANQGGNALATPVEIKKMLLLPSASSVSDIAQPSDLRLIQHSTVAENALTFATGAATKFGNTVNGRTHQQTPLLAYRGYQYVTFFDSKRRVCIGRRKLPAGDWEVINFEDHRFITNDSHNTAVIGICDKDGTIHMAFDHHASQLNYRVSKLGAAHVPDSVEWNVSLFGGVSHTLGSVAPDESVTYPRFFPTPSGNLMLFYRAVTSGNGDGMLEEYDGDRHDWTPGLGKVIARDIGTYTFNGKTSAQRCPYMNSVSYAGGRLHASWVWRDRFERTNPIYQHDLCYAYSDDDGRTWCNSDGKLIGETGKNPIHLDSPGLVVAPISSGSWLTNSNTHFAYADGSIHIVMRRRVKDVWRSRYVHYWRNSDGKWSNQVLPFSGGRPKLVGDNDRSLVLIYEDEERLHIAKGQPNESQTSWQWTKVKLPRPHSNYGEAVVDLQRWKLENVLSIYSQEEPTKEIRTKQQGAIDGIPSPLNVVDYQWPQHQREHEGLSQESYTPPGH